MDRIRRHTCRPARAHGRSGWWAGLALFALSACAKTEASPEAQIRATLEEARLAAERRDLSGLMAPISDSGFRCRQMDRAATKRFLFGLLHRGQWRKVALVRTRLTWPSADRAELRSFALMGTGDDTPTPATALRAGGLYELKLSWARQGERFVVVEADYARVTRLDELLGGSN